MYDLYKPLRNDLRRQSLFQSLHVVWAWVQHLQFDKPFPPNMEVPIEIMARLSGPEKGIFEWELAILAKELIINAPLHGEGDFCKWSRFSTALNRLKNLGNEIGLTSRNGAERTIAAPHNERNQVVVTSLSPARYANNAPSAR